MLGWHTLVDRLIVVPACQGPIGASRRPVVIGIDRCTAVVPGRGRSCLRVAEPAESHCDNRIFRRGRKGGL